MLNDNIIFSVFILFKVGVYNRPGFMKTGKVIGQYTDEKLKRLSSHTDILFRDHCLNRVKQCDRLMVVFRKTNGTKYRIFMENKNYYLSSLINKIKCM